MLALTQGLLSVGSGSGGGAPPGAHRYWRILVLMNNGASFNQSGVTELRLIDAAGVNRVLPNTAETPASASSQVNSPNRAYAAFDGNTSNTGWISTSSVPYPHWLRWDFGATGARTPVGPVEVKQVTIFPSWNLLAGTPRDFDVEWSDDNLAWTNALSVRNQTGWSVGTPRTFDVF
jgi:hypothetical protein